MGVGDNGSEARPVLKATSPILRDAVTRGCSGFRFGCGAGGHILEMQVGCSIIPGLGGFAVEPAKVRA